jgi:hypothetical protein
MKKVFIFVLFLLLTSLLQATNEIQFAYKSAYSPNLYAIISRTSDSKVWDVTHMAWVTYEEANEPNYALSLSLIHKDEYGVSFPTGITTGGMYSIAIYLRSGSVPNVTNDLLVGIGEMAWDGSAEITDYTVASKDEIAGKSLHQESKNSADKKWYEKVSTWVITFIFFLTALTTLLLNLDKIRKKFRGKEGKQYQENQKAIMTKLDNLLKSTDSENKNKLLEKYPAGYVSFGVDSSGTFSSTVFPHGKEVLAEYEFDWSNVKIEKLTSSALTILLPNIHYKPLNTQLLGSITMTINRRPSGKEHIFPVEPKGTLHRIYIELLKDDNHQLIFVIGFRKTTQGESSDVEAAPVR